MKILRLSNNYYEENCYIVVDKDDVTIIDPGFNYDKIVEYLTANNLSVTRILLTHGHIDHIGDIDKLNKKYPNCPIYLNDHDIPFLYDATLNVSKMNGKPKIYKEDLNIIPVFKEIVIGDYKMYPTPGHTIGSMIIEKNDFLFTGDTLFKGTVGRTDLPTGNINDLNTSLLFISKSFSKEKKILPGHYDYSTIKEELKNNPYLRKKNKAV